MYTQKRVHYNGPPHDDRLGLVGRTIIKTTERWFFVYLHTKNI